MENKNNFMDDWKKWSDEKTEGMDDNKSKKELGAGFRDYAEFLHKENKSLKLLLLQEFKVGDIVYISPKSLGNIDSCDADWHSERCKIIKITPKRFKIEWDADGQTDPVTIYVKKIYKNSEDVQY